MEAWKWTIPLEFSFVFLARVSVSLFLPGLSALCGPCWVSWLQSYLAAKKAHKPGPQTDVQPRYGGLPVRTDVPIRHWSKEPVEGVQGRPVEVEAPTEEDLVSFHSGHLLPESFFFKVMACRL